VTEGKIRSFGTSKLPASEIVEAQWVAERRGHGRFRSEQPPYNILTRAVEYDLLPTCQRHGIGVMAYSPLAGGWLSGKYRKGQEAGGPGAPVRQRRFAALYDAASPANAAKLDAAYALGELADEAGITLVRSVLFQRGLSSPPARRAARARNSAHQAKAAVTSRPASRAWYAWYLLSSHLRARDPRPETSGSGCDRHVQAGSAPSAAAGVIRSAGLTDLPSWLRTYRSPSRVCSVSRRRALRPPRVVS
jgi:hypothetical protein